MNDDPQNPNDRTILRPRAKTSVGGDKPASPLEPSDDKTVFRAPASSRRVEPAAPAPRPSFKDDQTTTLRSAVTSTAAPRDSKRSARVAELNVAELGGSANNPLLVYGTPLLLLAAQLQQTTSRPPVEQLKSQCVAEIQRLEKQLKTAGLTTEVVVPTRYVICTFIDEAVLGTPWGESSDWSSESLLALFHREGWGGQKVFQLLDRLQEDTRQNIDLIELIFVCMSLGFMGMYHTDPRGTAKLSSLQQEVCAQIRNVRGSPERKLSPHAEGVTDARNPILRSAPVWVWALSFCGVLLTVFVLLYFGLSQKGSAISSALAAVGREPATLPDLEPLAEPPTDRPTLYSLLEPERRAGLLQVEEYADESRVIMDGAMFGSGSAQLDDGHLAAIKRVAEVIAALPGTISVEGHTDDVPLRSIRFRNNYDLSQARAEAVSEILGRYPANTSRLEVRGVGPDLPRYKPATTPENRARNRRVEIIFRPAVPA